MLVIKPRALHRLNSGSVTELQLHFGGKEDKTKQNRNTKHILFLNVLGEFFRIQIRKGRMIT